MLVPNPKVIDHAHVANWPKRALMVICGPMRGTRKATVIYAGPLLACIVYLQTRGQWGHFGLMTARLALAEEINHHHHHIVQKSLRRHDHGCLYGQIFCGSDCGKSLHVWSSILKIVLSRIVCQILYSLQGLSFERSCQSSTSTAMVVAGIISVNLSASALYATVSRSSKLGTLRVGWFSERTG